MFRLQKIFALVIPILIVTSCTFDEPNVTQPDSGGATTEKTVPHSPKPENNSIDQSLTITLEWTAENVSKFDLYFDVVNPPQNLLAGDTTTNKVAVQNLDYNTKYFWRAVSKFDDGTKAEGPVWNFTTMLTPPQPDSGYTLHLHKIETSLPSYVNVMFRVSDLLSNGITNLSAADFEVYEDGELVSASESELQIQKGDEAAYKLKSVLLLDNSTSLKNNIDQIRNAAETFVQNISANQEIAIYHFSEETELLADFTNSTDSLISALKRYQAGNPTTNLYGSVIKGASRWENIYTMNEIIQGAMIIFTDGKETQGSATLADALSAVDKKIVYTIGLGTEIQPDILSAIGTAGYYSINSADQLNQQFDLIRRQIINYASSFYKLVYKSPKRGNFNHTLTVRIKNNLYSGEQSYISGGFNSGGFTSN